MFDEDEDEEVLEIRTLSSKRLSNSSKDGTYRVVRAKSDAHFASVFGAGTTRTGPELVAGRAKHGLCEYRTTGFTAIV